MGFLSGILKVGFVENMAYLNVQQTPKPEAQLPAAEPPALVHSSDLRHIPIVVVSVVVLHSSLSNETTEKSDNKPKEYSKNFKSGI